MTIRLAILAVILFAVRSPAADPVDYVRHIKPLLKERCSACHGTLKQQGKLRLDTVPLIVKGGKSGPAIKPGDPAGSLLLERVSDPDEDSRMPPEGKPLSAEQISLLKTWIAEGAKGPADEAAEADPRAHWAFRRPVRPPVPIAIDPAWNANPIDRFLAAEHAKRELRPVPETDHATLLRRVYIDLIGLPPTRDELHAFLADTSADAYEKVVDRLLASPQYGERWARHWMDVWRYSDWYGRRAVPDVLNSYGQIWRWRDWIVRGVNADRGYDEMVRMMLAADELAPGNDEETVATGFLVRNFFRWNYNNWMRDNVEHTAKAFLGLTMNCCHCHDHKYDPLSQEEYFRFRAIFEPLEIRHDRWPGEPDPGPYPKYSYGAAYGPIKSGMARVMDEKLDAKTLFYTGGDERNVDKGKPPVPPGVPAALGGTFHVEPVALPRESWDPGSRAFVRRDETIKREQALAAARAALAKAKLAKDLAAIRLAEAQLAAARSDLEALGARIAADDGSYSGICDYPEALAHAANWAEARHRLDASLLDVVQKEAALDAARKAKNPAGVTAAEKQLADARKKADAACRALEAAPAATYTPLSPKYPASSTGRRTALAKWLTSRENPLTARVAVNHVWSWHFGRPLVETTNNFGRSGKPPSHPELLDWLAIEFMDNGWQSKPLHRLIVLSRAYRSRSDPSTEYSVLSTQKDPDNVYLWKFPTLRMEAEVVRDGLIHVAGELNATMGGVEIAQDQAQTTRRRSIYLAHHGETRAEFLDLFDAANPCDAYRRTTSVLPQQALALSNSELAARLARDLERKLPAEWSDVEFVAAGFEQVLGRLPRPAEAAAAVAFLERQVRLLESQLVNVDPDARARANLIHVLFNHTDFVTVR
jgi:Protein of unknown function (DUF1553)/Protein of unknown function (DUF1549)/Planctomycete cytochrome C